MTIKYSSNFCVIVGFVLLGVFVQFLRADDETLCLGIPDGETVLFPYEANCSLYWRCEGQVITLDECPDNLYFSNALQSCDYPETSGCTNPTTTIEPTSGPICSGNETEYFPHPTNCSKYIECYLGEASEMDCPSGLWFNADEDRCVMPEESGCSDGSVTTTSTSTIPPTTSDGTRPTYTTPDPVCWGVRPGETVLRAYEGDCNKYWECYGAEMTLMSCPPQLYFSEERQLCDWPELTTCIYTTTENPNPDPSSTTNQSPTTPDGDDDPRCVNQSITYWPHPSNCSKYIECYRGHGYEMNCPSGLWFDSESKMCKNPSESDCATAPTSPTEATTEPIDTTTRSSDFTEDPDCVDADTGYIFPYEGDCTKFWECDNGIKQEMDCPSGLYFNPTLLICDYPYQAGCEYYDEWQLYLKQIFAV